MPRDATDELLIYRWINGFFASSEEMYTELRKGGIPCENGYHYQALLLRIDRYRTVRQQQGMEKINRARGDLLALCKENFPQGFSCIGSDTYVVTILALADVIRPEYWKQKLQDIRSALLAQHQITLTIGIGTRSASAAAVPESVRNAYIAARYRLVFGPGQTIQYTDIAMRVGVAPAYPEDEIRLVLKAFERGDTAEFERHLNLLFSACYSQSVQFGLIAAGHLLMELFRIMPPDMQPTCDIVGVYTQLTECEDLTQQLTVIRAFGLTAIQTRQQEDQISEKHTAQMKSILDYVHANYHQPDLSMTSIAEHAGISANTVRMLFRGSGLASPKDYIQKLRMEEACRLLRETSLTASQIGEKVGYFDSRYFYVSFKKYTGKTAYEYRADTQK